MVQVRADVQDWPNHEEAAGMTGGAAGSIRRRRLGIELRELRTRAGLTLEQVAQRFDWSVSKASRMELGRVPVTRRDVVDLLDLYGVTDEEQRDGLVAIARSGRERDWWHRYDDVLPRPFSIYLSFETDAASISTYQSLLVPGLLQTAEYARALVRAARPHDADEDVERRVEARLQRQEILRRENPPQLWAILDEAAVRREVGGADVMRTQLKRLLDMGKRPEITLQVLPFRAGAYISMDSGFILLGFDDPRDPDVASVDLLTRSLYFEDHGEVGRYRVAFEHLRATAASPADSTKMIAAVMKEMDHDGKARA
jgi:transcriptional regulator with XRE-family HTH domain